MSKPNIICVVSVRNDSWILKNFLECATKWADWVIVGDHNSTDNSVEIAQQFDCVKTIFHEPSSSFLSRRRDLLVEARKIPGPRIIFILDSDEMISANWSESPDWRTILNAEPGVCFSFEWVELRAGLRDASVFWMPTIFVDDGSEYPAGEAIHESRVPITRFGLTKLYDIKLLHYAMIDPVKIFSKHRYYKCYEFIELKKRPWALDVYYQDTTYKTYNAPLIPVKDEWLEGYNWLNKYKEDKQQGQDAYWYDAEVLNYFDLYGVEKFRRLNIWDVDWNKKAELLNRRVGYRDPRSPYEVWIHKFIEKNREGLKMSPQFQYRVVRLFARTALRALGW